MTEQHRKELLRLLLGDQLVDQLCEHVITKVEQMIPYTNYFNECVTSQNLMLDSIDMKSFEQKKGDIYTIFDINYLDEILWDRIKNKMLEKGVYHVHVTSVDLHEHLITMSMFYSNTRWCLFAIPVLWPMLSIDYVKCKNARKNELTCNICVQIFTKGLK